jgi:hypothetical protein
MGNKFGLMGNKFSLMENKFVEQYLHHSNVDEEFRQQAKELNSIFGPFKS